MNYIVNGKKVSIDTNKKPFAQGSEGKLYLKEGILYKIYYDNALNDGFGDKRFYHTGMIGIETKQIDVPQSTILDQNGKYVGYTTSCITRKIKDNFGITKISREKLLDNIEIILNDINILSDLHILMNDVSYFNYLLNEERMYLIDPGRYRFSDSDCQRKNLMQFKELLILLTYLDLSHYKTEKKRKVQILRQLMKQELQEMDVYDYFSKICSQYENLEEYSLERIRYLK